MFFLILLLFLIFNTSHILANDRNIFGLHLTQTSDIHQVQHIINSSNGDWGWVTIVIRSDQLNHQTWQDFFDNCRRFHLIPIVRLATTVEGDNWKRPTNSDIDNLASFLNSLNWPTTNQHVIVFNEINHASEWGGEVDIHNYADTAIYTSQKFKHLNSNFFVLPAALDLATPSQPPKFESASNTYQQILAYQPNFFDHFNGLASHPYPNHGYIGTPADTGQHSILGYRWESKIIGKNLPVFITETGWPHAEGIKTNHYYYRLATTVKFLQQAFNTWQLDSQVIAVTPFIFNYTQEPFDHFSWLDQNQLLYPQYQSLIDLPKSQNQPQQTTNYQKIKHHLPLIIFSNNEYSGYVSLKNTGQSIWGEHNFCLPPKSSDNIKLEMICTDSQLTEPGLAKQFNFKFTVSPSNNRQQKSFIAWQGIEPIYISPINSSGTIYRPKTNLLYRLRSWLYQNFKI